MGTFLSKMGINKNTAHEVRSGSLRYGGMAVPEVYTEQGAGANNKMMISHLRKNDMVGQAINVQIDTMQLLAGTSFEVLSQSSAIVQSYMTDCWSSNAWKFNDSYGLTIHRENKTWLLPQREHDCFIMEEIAKLPTSTRAKLIHAQRCRMFLQVTTLADICNSEGTQLADWITSTNDDNSNPRSSKLIYPNQQRPDSTVWRSFVKQLREAFTTNNAFNGNNTPTSTKLRRPLGKWYKGRILQAWNQVYDNATDTVYSFDPAHKSVRKFNRPRHNGQRFRHTISAESVSFPINCIPISGKFESGFFIIDSRNNASITPPPAPRSNNDSIQRMLRGLVNHVPLDEIATAIWNGDAIIGSDGSVADDFGTYSFVILINLDQDEPTLAVSLGGNLPEIAEFLDMDSHRPEAAALYAGLTYVRRLLEAHPPISATQEIPRIRFYLDNKSVTQDLEWDFTTDSAVFDYLKADYDILQGITSEIELLPIHVSVRWVKGHQDDTTEWDDLSIAAKANCHADRICTETHYQHPNATGRFPEWVPGLKAALLHNGRLVTKRQDEYVTTAATTPRHRKYLIKKSQRRDPFITTDWTDATFDDIDFRALEQSMKATSFGRRIQISKFAHNWTPTRDHLACIDNKVDRRCFACGNLKENIDHVLRCPSDRRAAARLKAINELRKHLSDYYTPAPMSAIIIDSVSLWLEGRRPTVPLLDVSPNNVNSELHLLINDAYTHQCSIGWSHFLHGRISLHWKLAIRKYYSERQPGLFYNPNLWSRKTIDQLWKFYLTIWHGRNGELYGKDYDEQREIALRTTREEAQRVYADTKDRVSDRDSHFLHSHPAEAFLNWTKSHLDAYLATAEVILEQNVEPG
jgi:hypothetical protein